MKNIIKKSVLGLTFGLLLSFSSYAQKIAVVDIQKVLTSMDDYNSAQAQLNKDAESWKQEISQKHDEIKGLYNKYQAEQVLMTEEMKQQKEDEIMAKEKEVMALNRQKFGEDGELFKRRQELIEPIQDRVYKAISSYANTRGYDFIFDKNGSSGMLFINDTFDKTDEIIKKLTKK